MPSSRCELNESRKNQVTVVGAVETPGAFELPRGASSLMAALVAAGGLSEEASGDVEIRHTDPRLVVPGVLEANRPEGPTAGQARARLARGAAAGRRRGRSRESPGGGDGRPGPTHAPGRRRGERDQAEPASGTRDGTGKQARGDRNVGKAGGSAAGRPGAFRRLFQPGGGQGRDCPAAGGRRGSDHDRREHQKAIDGDENVLLSPGDTVVIRQTPETVVTDILKSFIRFGISGSVPLF